MEFSFLEDEKFDFDLPLSPTEDERNPEVEDDDEIFFGPVGHKERCVATNAATKATKILDDIENTKALSPLNPEQVVEIFKEATSMAVMLKSCSAGSDSEDQRNDFPELITDINNKNNNRVLDKTQDENNGEKEQINDKIGVELNDDCEGFVVRRRALKERNSAVNGKESSQIQRIKAAPSNPRATSRKTKTAVTPTRSSLSMSRTERYSSSASDTSFGEEKVRKSGLKAPGFSSCPRRRSSSNSSTSSNCSLPSFNLNETFTVAKSSDQSKATNIKQPTNRKTQPTSKGMLTKAITSKPLFAKPSEVPKTSKFQPIKAVQTRSMSSSRLRSPARLKANVRPASAGSTPLKAQTPQAESTPGNRTTPMRRRSSNYLASSTAVKARLNASTSALPEKTVTPRTGIPGIPGKGKTSGTIAKRPNSAIKGTKMNTKPTTQKPITPENRLKKTAIGTPEKTAATPEDRKKVPGSAHKRRSFLPTPNLRNTESKIAKPSSPAARNKSVKSPDTSKTIERAKNLIKKLDLNPESPKNDIITSNMPVEKTNEECKIDVELNSKSPPVSNVQEVPDLMIQESPPVPKAPLVDVVTDPFSPGIDSPNFTTDEVLNPIVIGTNGKDLIDLSYQSPKPEIDLIDLAAKSPLVEAKLVDI